MFLKKIALKNIRSIKKMELDFESGEGLRRWTILLGENGSGTSTVLRSTALVLAGSEGLVELIGRPGSWVRRGEREGRISAVLQTARGEERKIHLVLRPKDDIRDVLNRNVKSMQLLDNALAHSSRSYLTLGYGISRRVGAGRESRREFRSPRAASLATLFRSDVELVSLGDWATDLHYRKGAEGLKAIKAAMQNILPDAEFDHINAEERELMFKTNDGLMVPLDSLSDGYQGMVAFCGDLLYQVTGIFDDYKDPLSARGVLLIDEVGLHLHPKWQRKLIRLLKERLPNFQVIATTHSPLTAHQAGEGELCYLVPGSMEEGSSLQVFEGAPNKMLLHQFITSPIFGIDTVSSIEMESAREQFKKLRNKKRKTAADRKRMAELKEELDGEETWTKPDTARDRKLDALMQKIEADLGKKKGGRA